MTETTTSLTIDRYASDGKVLGSVGLDPTIFGVTINVPLMHQVVTAQLAARRSGTQKTKTRAEVAGGAVVALSAMHAGGDVPAAVAAGASLVAARAVAGADGGVHLGGDLGGVEDLSRGHSDVWQAGDVAGDDPVAAV